ncbi:MAG: hypothetical protein M3R48_02570 [Candidatus Dormibacteraeota bacterium]|nr:hypothetical protein [Candidatus Dormibacteraeota bacterium]
MTVGQALHWMDYERLFAIVRPLLRPGGGVAVVANGTPLWLQGSAPSRALRRFMEEWLNTPVSDNACGTDAESRHRYTAGLEALGFAVSEAVTEYSLTLDAQEVAGAMFSAMSPEQLPGPDDRGAFISRLAAALPNDEPFIEVVRVVALVAKL